MTLAATDHTHLRTCCYRSALDLQAGYCDDCGHPLLRCAAYVECGGLLDRQGACDVCIAPELSLDAGGVREASIGGELAIPLLLRNRSKVGRPLFVKGVWTRERSAQWQPIELSWDRLDGDARAPITARAVALERAGVHQLEILIAFASRWRWREEVVAYTAGLAITVAQQQALTVQQNIHLAADSAHTGTTIYAPFRFDAGDATASERDPAREPQPLPLTRAGLLERVFGLRGLVDGPAVPRDARLIWRGFDVGSAPLDGPIVGGDGLLVLGRARARAQGGTTDARLLALRPDQRIDEPASRAISRHHFGLYLENDRLMLRVESERGGWLNDRHLTQGATIALADGDRFSPLVDGPGGATLTVRFDQHHGLVENVTLTRTPPAPPLH